MSRRSSCQPAQAPLEGGTLTLRGPRKSANDNSRRASKLLSLCSSEVSAFLEKVAMHPCQPVPDINHLFKPFRDQAGQDSVYVCTSDV